MMLSHPMPGLNHPPRKAAVCLLLAILFLLASCGRRDEGSTTRLGSEETLAGSANLVCEEECRQRGQCGQVNAIWVVLMSSAGPSTTNHDLSFPANSSVSINQQQMALVESISDPGETWREPFYEVIVPERGVGWVAGWCIAQEIVP